MRTSQGQYAYANDALGRRTSVVNEGSAFPKDIPNDPAGFFNVWRYNSRSELESSRRGRGTTVADEPTSEKTAERRAYAYDHIGNRANHKTWPDCTETTLYYCRSNRNQYEHTDDANTCTTPFTEDFGYDVDGNLTVDGTLVYE